MSGSSGKGEETTDIHLCNSLINIQVFIITGGYSGVGLELAMQLYRENATVYMRAAPHPRLMQLYRRSMIHSPPQREH
jgi:NADP-dependent 3-hydroxy acid dehydrogenase YdfG